MPVQQTEPWLRGTHPEVDPVQRAVLHALELAQEEILHWCHELDLNELASRPCNLPSVAFQMRHIGRSLDRLMTYAEGDALTDVQLKFLQSEHEAPSSRDGLFQEFEESLSHAVRRLLAFNPSAFTQARGVGRAHLPTTVTGLLIHCAEHTQRHTGQAITTAKVVLALRQSSA